MPTDFTLDELLSLYDTVQSEIIKLSFSDFEGCEQALIKDHSISTKLLQTILQQRKHVN